MSTTYKCLPWHEPHLIVLQFLHCHSSSTWTPFQWSASGTCAYAWQLVYRWHGGIGCLWWSTGWLLHCRLSWRWCCAPLSAVSLGPQLNGEYKLYKSILYKRTLFTNNSSFPFSLSFSLSLYLSTSVSLSLSTCDILYGISCPSPLALLYVCIRTISIIRVSSLKCSA